MSLFRKTLRSRRALLFMIVPPMATVLAVAGLIITGAFSGSSVSAVPTACRDADGVDLEGQALRLCILRQAMFSESSEVVEEAIAQVEAIATTGLVALDSPDPEGAVGAAAGPNDPTIASQTQVLRTNAMNNMMSMADSLGEVVREGDLNDDVRSTALRTELSLRSIAEVMQKVSGITANCGMGDTIAHPDDPSNPDPFSPCNQLLPLSNIDSVSNENPFVLQHMDPIDKYTTTGLFPSYSVPLRADIIPPRWSREIPELVEVTDALDVNQCALIFKETRGLQLRLHFDRWNVVRTPILILGEGLTFVEEQEPIWSLEWQPAEYVRGWEICNNNGELNVTVENHVNREEPLNFFWRFYETGD